LENLEKKVEKKEGSGGMARVKGEARRYSPTAKRHATMEGKRALGNLGKNKTYFTSKNFGVGNSKNSCGKERTKLSHTLGTR